MDIPLIQYICDDCGKLSDVLDCDQSLPKGWLMISSHTHYCNECADNHRHEDDSNREMTEI